MNTSPYFTRKNRVPVDLTLPGHIPHNLPGAAISPPRSNFFPPEKDEVDVMRTPGRNSQRGSSERKEENQLFIQSSEKGLRNSKNLFANLYSDSNSKLMERGEELQPREVRSKRQTHVKLEDLDSNSYIESVADDRRSSIGSIAEEEVNHEKISFHENSHPRSFYSNLLCFSPNQKNGRNLAYNLKKHTCQPIYKCQGCSKKFEVPSALGGHLSSCHLKFVHHKRLSSSEKEASKILSPIPIRSSPRLLASFENSQYTILSREEFESARGRFVSEVKTQGRRKKKHIRKYALTIKRRGLKRDGLGGSGSGSRKR